MLTLLKLCRGYCYFCQPLFRLRHEFYKLINRNGSAEQGVAGLESKLLLDQT